MIRKTDLQALLAMERRPVEGFHVGYLRKSPDESCLCDISRDYYNLLARTVNSESETYTYDSNVVSMSKADNDYFYMLD